MKVGIVSDDIRTISGIAQQAKYLAEGLASKDFSVVNFGFSYKRLAAEQLSHNLYAEPILDIDNFIVTFKKNPTDCLILIGDPLYLQYIFDVRELLDVPLYWWHVLDSGPTPYYNLYYYRKCDSIACISQYTKTQLLKIDSLLPVEYIPHTLPEWVYKPDFIAKKKNPGFVLLWSNRCLTRKNLPLLLLAWQQFWIDAGKPADATLVLHTNPAIADEVNAPPLIQSLGLNTTVRIDSERYSETEMVNGYQAVSGVVNVSSREGFGLSTLQAGMCGTLSILVNGYGMADQCIGHNLIANPSLASFYLQGGMQPIDEHLVVDEKHVAEQITRLYNMNKSFETMTYCGKEQARLTRQTFSYANMLDSWARILDKQ